uniref:Peroxiredoxin-5 n=1 Tax=Mimachlamys nobilis TaxID=106276 RepID=A0A220T630_MIMNO|nr:peroxiredoxin [Mimachlamys nobilis]
MSLTCLRLRAVCRAVGYSKHFTRTGTANMSVKVGDGLPNAELFENTPDNKIQVQEAFKSGTHIIFGVPGAFTPGCSKTHLPGYVNGFDKLKGKGIETVNCVSVNDPFVMEAWGKAQNADGKVRMLADTCGTFTKGLGLDLDVTAVLGNVRCKGFSMVVKDGKVENLFVEPDGTGLTCTLSENVMDKL